ncbi:hypothetical protein Q8F55_008211 [Vanrija albida]|uniref:Uncharacterized protein n=1 Tax=Vanrija albida TaxID=181172 RepID=A0ABR3PWJ7_9TREE
MMTQIEFRGARISVSPQLDATDAQIGAVETQYDVERQLKTRLAAAAPRFAAAVLSAYVEHKYAKGKDAPGVAHKLETLETKMPQFAVTFRSVRRAYRLGPSRVLGASDAREAVVRAGEEGSPPAYARVDPDPASAVAVAALADAAGAALGDLLAEDQCPPWSPAAVAGRDAPPAFT